MSKFVEVVSNYEALSEDNKVLYYLNLAYILNLNIFNDKNVTIEKLRVCSEINHRILSPIFYNLLNKKYEITKDFFAESFLKLMYEYMIEIFDEEICFKFLLDTKSIKQIKAYENSFEFDENKKVMDIKKYFSLLSESDKSLLLKDIILEITLTVRGIFHYDEDNKIEILKSLNTLSLKIIIQLFSYLECDKPYYPEDIFFFELKKVFNKENELYYYSPIYHEFKPYYQKLKKDKKV